MKKKKRSDMLIRIIIIYSAGSVRRRRVIAVKNYRKKCEMRNTLCCTVGTRVEVRSFVIIFLV